LATLNIFNDADPFDLQRFLDAQDGVFETACSELRRGRKQSHWMWFGFPQLKELGVSAAFQHYGIGSVEEAVAYLAHPVLGPQLFDDTRLMLTHRSRPLRSVLGSPDDLKFRSSMTLYSHVAAPGSVFAEALDELCGGQPDVRTLALLSAK
jgi:uncharacterized protein (DUF1810 family)